MRPFGSLGPRIEVSRYKEQWEAKIAAVQRALEPALPPEVLGSPAVFPSPATGHRHRAGPLAVLPGRTAESTMELAMWDPIAKEYSIVRASDVPIYSAPIAVAMDILRRLPIKLDPDIPAASACTLHASDIDADDVPDSWGAVVGRALRSVQFHSTMSSELLVCMVYHDARLRSLRRGEQLSSEDGTEREAWLAAASEFRKVLQEELARAGVVASVNIVGRWKRRRLAVERACLFERLTLADGRQLSYLQPEGQFSNPNAPCEVCCLDWLCAQAALIRRECGRSAALLELHCGSGTNTVALAPYFRKVLAVEINRVLAEAAEESLRANGVGNVQLVRAASALAQGHVAGALGEPFPQAVLVDPPRAGLDDETRALVAGFEHVLYISCNPGALAGDILVLSVSHDVVALAIFDMFPYTTHAECAVRLRRRRQCRRGTARWWRRCLLHEDLVQSRSPFWPCVFACTIAVLTGTTMLARGLITSVSKFRGLTAH